ncbi:PHD finger protein 20-like isoform X3 [Trachinotus anak]
MKTPPERSGITFKVGAQLEARDRHKNWYSATIEKIDFNKEQVLIHYRQWSRRHDEWFHWNSPYLRPLERVSLRRRGLNPPRSQPMFVSGTKVLACWTDCRFYPAKIIRVNKDDSYTVRFYDGVVRTVKPTKVKPFKEKSRSEKSAVGSEGWEEGESEEEDGGEREEEENKGGEVEEKVTSEENEGTGEGEGEGERKRKAEASSSHPAAKKKADESRSSGAQTQPITADSTQPAVPNPTHIDRDVLLERQAHLPTTHKFSREPLYRVIKNQPPPILSIELDHNPFKCPAAGCTKSFRKASLLHYHIKYYHSDQQLDEQGSEQEASRRKRSSSEGGDFVSDRKNENQNISCHRDDGEHSTMGTGRTEVKTDGGREKTTGQNRKDRKNFLRVKLKKKKKKKKKKKSQSGLGSSDDENSDRPPITLKLPTGPHNTHTQVDDGSDWSTLTAESGEDTPSWPVAMDTEECEVVRCVCEVDEENDFMIQCESCLCWQHGTCMGLYEDNVPHNYICYYCRHTAGWRRAQRFLSEPDLLISGHMFGLSCVKENYSEINASKITHTSRLLAHIHGLNQVLSGLQLKISLLHSPSHPDLQLWRLPWRRQEGPRLTSSPRGDPAICYVSSEHCYQKPGASWEKAEEREKERQTAAVKQEHDSEQKEIKPEDISRPVTDPTASDDRNTVPHTDTHSDTSIKTEKHTQAGCEEHTHTQTFAAEPRPAPVAECQLNLLEHVESLHHQISARMDLIERELDVLESWLDHSGELEPPDPLSRLPQLKQRIRRLLRDLCTVRHLSVYR